MAKKKNVQKQLADLITAYGINKDELDGIKKICDKQNSKIKEIMSTEKISEFETDDYIAKYYVQNRESMDEERLVEVFLKANEKKFRELGILKTRDYVDSDALESAIYHGKISKDLMLKIGECKESKEVPTLKISKVKKGDWEYARENVYQQK